MKHTENNADKIIVDAYNEYYRSVLQYTTSRICHKYEAEDLTQEVFLRLLGCKHMIRQESVKYFIFTIARNIVTDYIRKYYKNRELHSYLYETGTVGSTESEELIIVRDVLRLENNKLNTFPTQRKMIYALNRYREKSVPEISRQLNLSRRTVENHLLLGRKAMRTYLTKYA